MNSHAPARHSAHATQPASHFGRRDAVTVALGVLVIAYGIASLACGGPQKTSRAEEPGPEPEMVRGPASQSEPTVVHFAVEEAGLEMSLPMARYVLQAGPRGVNTSGVVSGDWFVRNFTYGPRGLDTTSEGGISDAVVVALQHRQLDAEALVWTVEETWYEGERYLDAAADTWIGRLLVAVSLLDVLSGEEPLYEGNLEGLVFGITTVGARAALQIDMWRVHPVTRVRQQLRVFVVRQVVGAQQVLFIAACVARRDDFAAAAQSFQTTLANLVMTGQPVEIGLNPSRALGPAGAEYVFAPSNESAALAASLEAERSKAAAPPVVAEPPAEVEPPADVEAPSEAGAPEKAPAVPVLPDDAPAPRGL